LREIWTAVPAESYWFPYTLNRETDTAETLGLPKMFSEELSV